MFSKDSRGGRWIAGGGLLAGAVLTLGCSTTQTDTAGDESSTDGDMQRQVTWHEHVAPIVLAKCSGCHQDGSIAPLSFVDHATTAPAAQLIALTVEAGTMPPFGADETDECRFPHPIVDDLRLSDEEKALLRAWADDGAPEGDPKLATEIPTPPSTTLDIVDQRLQMKAQVTIDSGPDSFMCFSLDPELTEDRFLSALQIVPGNDKIVHHVLIYVDGDGASSELADEDGYFECSGAAAQGSLVGAWAPGVLPNRMPADTGMLVPAGSRLVMNVHYHPSGAGPEQDDSTAIELTWHEQRPPFAAQLALIGNSEGEQLLPGPNDRGDPEFFIPAGAKGHTEEMQFEIPSDIPAMRIWQVGAHMHYVGVDMLITLRQQQAATSECLLQTPYYDFSWQRGYVYDAPLDELPIVRGGDELYLRCTYDNTLENKNLARALQQQGLSEPIDVHLGEETLDEMCLAVFGVAFPNVL
jgi:hypothetical protein